MKTVQSQPVIVVTGAGKGIGEATVQELIQRKAEIQNRFSTSSFALVLTSRTEADLQKLKTHASQHGIPCEILPLELTDHPAAPITFACEKLGRVDVLIHSAGVGRFKPFLELTAEDLQFVSKTNIEASFLLMQNAYAQMKKQKFGHLIWITSVAAEKPFEESAVYCMSKYAQRGLIEVMRLQGYQDGIRITDVKPGAAYTPMWGNIPNEMKAKMMTSQDVAQSIVDSILISPTASIEEITIRPLHGDF